ncbi:MAG: hypothetical protein M5U18_14375 [Dehalococcoidia bacterium]|nr:hypothetical protein [Dehalococcoidia bacterium]
MRECAVERRATSVPGSAGFGPTIADSVLGNAHATVTVTVITTNVP